MKRLGIALLAVCFSFAFTACSDDSSSGDGGVDALPDFPRACGPTAVDKFELPIEKNGDDGNYVFTLTTVAPAPIDVGDTTLTIQTKDLTGTAVTGASSVLKPFMPEHGHGTAPPTYGGSEKTDGAYEHGPVNLMMPGVWTFTFTVTGSDNKVDKVTFSFCLEG